ncbi:MAG: WD40 repeat domain-containing serine/threonine protein kinase [Phycisphaerales bacterium]
MRTQIMDTDPSDSTQGSDRAPPARADVDGRLSEGSTLGNYTIKRIIGSGGMGRVYEARQENPRRTVAIKVMSRGMTSASALRRFEFEAQVLGRLRHPGIAQILEAGRLQDGTTPWFAMEYIANAKPITEYARDARLSTRDRLRLFRQACEAVAHGHQRGVIHRDLKPSNILVDGAGHVKVIDFGVARTTDSDMAVTTLQTSVGQLVGTVQYMSPEQFDADPHDIDIRSDVYALGVVLYELLTDRCPYELGRKAIHEAARIVREEDPPRPSTVRAALRGDLEVIVGTAMAKDRTRRYGSASELSQDLGRWLEGEAIAARAPGVIETIRRFARRHRAAAAAIATAFVLLTGSLAVMINLLQHAQRQNVELQTQTTRSEANLAEALDQQKLAREALGERDAALASKGPALYAGAMRAGFEALRAGDTFDLRRALEDARAAGMTGVERRFETRLLEASAHTEFLAAQATPDTLDGVALSPDARMAAIGGRDGTTQLWDTASGKRIATWQAHKGAVHAVAFSPDGRTLATASDDTTIALWNALGQEAVRIAALRGHTGPVRALAFSPDGRQIASGGVDRSIRIWDTLSHATLRTITGHEGVVLALAFHANGSRLASGSADRSVRVWDSMTGTPMHPPIELAEAPCGLAAPGDSNTLAVAVAGGRVSLHDQTGAITASLIAPDPLTGLAACGADLIIASARGVFRSNADRTVSMVAPDMARCVAVSADGSTVAAGDTDGVLRCWQAQTRTTNDLPPDGLPAHSIAMLAGPSPLLALGSTDGRTVIVDPVAQRSLAELAGAGAGVTALAASRDGTLLARGARDGRLEIWNTQTGERGAVLQERGQALASLSFFKDAQTLAACDDAGLLQLWNVATRAPLATLQPRGAPITAMAESADGSLLFTGGADGSVRVWDATARRELATLGGHERPVSSLAISADGKRLASGSLQGDVRLWDLASRKTEATLALPMQSVQTVAFDPTGQTVLCGTDAGQVVLWDAASGRKLGQLRPGVGAVRALALDAAGSMLAVGGSEGAVALRTESAGRTARARAQAESLLRSLRPTLQSWISAGGTDRALQEIQRAPASDQPALRDLLLLEGPSGLR